MGMEIGACGGRARGFTTEEAGGPRRATERVEALPDAGFVVTVDPGVSGRRAIEAFEDCA